MRMRHLFRHDRQDAFGNVGSKVARERMVVFLRDDKHEPFKPVVLQQGMEAGCDGVKVRLASPLFYVFIFTTGVHATGGLDGIFFFVIQRVGKTVERLNLIDGLVFDSEESRMHAVGHNDVDGGGFGNTDE